jgi:hypothetical protein
MSTAKTIIRRALRLIGELAAGQEPSGSAASDALERLQSLILDMPGLVQNGFWREAATNIVGYAPKEGHRITVTAPGTVILPLTVTHESCSRPPHDLAKVQIVGAATNAGLWLYSATKAAWGRADGLTLTSELPFGSEDDEGLSAQLAVYIADEYGEITNIGPRTIAKAGQSARSLRARLKKAEARDPHRPHLLHTHHIRDYW